MSDVLLALDLGTTHVRSLLVDREGRPVGGVGERAELSTPAPGRVEQDPEALFAAAVRTARDALERTGVAAERLAAVGVTTQRSSLVIWERASGRTLTSLVSWQDGRGSERARQLQAAGFPVLAQSAAAKLEAVLEAIPDGRVRMSRGELAWGNLDSWVVWRLTGGRVHATDPSQACATGYWDWASGGWSEALLEHQRLDPSLFPQLVATTEEAGRVTAEHFGVELPLAAVVADQQSAALAQDCREPGRAKVTYGTSATCNVATGVELRLATGAYPLVLWQHAGRTELCLEGMVITAGAFFDWLAGGLGVIDDPVEIAELASSVPDAGGVAVLPSLVGLGTPWAEPSARAVIAGLSRGSGRAHVVRAALEGVALRVREVIDALGAADGVEPPASLRADGGASRNDLLMQLQADLTGLPVERSAVSEATALGAALCAGIGLGWWQPSALSELHRVERVFEPALGSDERDARLESWRRTLGHGGPSGNR